MGKSEDGQIGKSCAGALKRKCAFSKRKMHQTSPHETAMLKDAERKNSQQAVDLALVLLYHVGNRILHPKADCYGRAEAKGDPERRKHDQE